MFTNNTWSYLLWSPVMDFPKIPSYFASQLPTYVLLISQHPSSMQVAMQKARAVLINKLLHGMSF